MSQSPTQAEPHVFDRAKGLNDAVAETKLTNGFVPFALNYLAGGDVWDRRLGRDFFLLESTGSVLEIHTLNWDDDTVINIATIGDTMYDLDQNITYFFQTGARLIIQSADGNYWDVTPNILDDLIEPTVVAAPGATPQTADLFVNQFQSLAFQVPTGSVDLLIDANPPKYGWYLQKKGAVIGPTTPFATDVVFTYASGFALKMADTRGNIFKFVVTNDGNLPVVTV